MEKKSNGLGIASMVIGIIALLLSCCYGGFLGIIGLILGIIVVTKQDTEKGTAIAGIITSSVAIIISIVMLIAGVSLMDYMGESSESPQTETSTDITSSSTTEADDTTENATNTFVVGDTVEGNGFKMTFVSSEDYTSDNQFLQPADGNKYMRFEFEFENTGDNDFIAAYWDFTCYADGYSVEQSYVADDGLSATISPGKKVIGAIYFELPADASEIELEYETNFWTENKIVFVVK